MPKRIDLTGHKIGRWQVLRVAESGREPNGKAVTRYLCLCECGTTRVVLTSSLRGERRSQSCGCLKKEKIAGRMLTHGHAIGGSVTKEYRAWLHMRDRCRNPRNKRYRHYGGRGITVCERWLDSFANFLADMGYAPKGATLERRDNNGNYDPGNCKWATYSEQNKNRRCHVIVWRGQSYPTLKSFAVAHKLNYKKFHRLYRTEHVPLEEILKQEGR